MNDEKDFKKLYGSFFMDGVELSQGYRARESSALTTKQTLPNVVLVFLLLTLSK